MKTIVTVRAFCAAIAALCVVAAVDAVAQVDDHADEIAQANADAALAKAQKEAADAQKAAIDAQVAANLAGARSIDDSGVKGKVTVNTNAGTGEATLLSAAAVRRAARIVATAVIADLGDAKVATSIPSPRVSVEGLATDGPARALADALNAAGAGGGESQGVLVASSEAELDVSQWQAFSVRVAILAHAFEDAHQSFESIEPARIDSIDRLSAESALASAGGFIQLASRVVSYFRSDYDAHNISLSPQQTLLTSSVGGQLADAAGGPQVYVLSNWPGAESTNQLVTVFHAIERLRLRAAGERALALRRAAATGVSDDLKTKYTRAAEMMANVLQSHDALLTSVSSSTNGQPTAIGTIARQLTVLQTVQRAKYVLITNINSAPAGMYTQQNLWTFFGGMPMHITAGAVITYQLINRQTNELISSDTVVEPGGYVRAGRVARRARTHP